MLAVGANGPATVLGDGLLLARGELEKAARTSSTAREISFRGLLGEIL